MVALALMDLEDISRRYISVQLLGVWGKAVKGSFAFAIFIMPQRDARQAWPVSDQQILGKLALFPLGACEYATILTANARQSGLSSGAGLGDSVENDTIFVWNFKQIAGEVLDWDLVYINVFCRPV